MSDPTPKPDGIPPLRLSGGAGRASVPLVLSIIALVVAIVALVLQFTT